MAFFGTQAQKPTTGLGNVSVNFLHRSECAACPLNHQPRLKHPHMEPAGTDEPDIYILGEAPGEQEDIKGVPFVGAAGRVLRLRIPENALEYIRWNNCVRTRPPGNRTPSFIEIECCRPSVVRDIEKTKPKVIIGFGNVPLHWALKETGITLWSGRRVPVKIGNHTCWFYPVVHPSAILHSRKFTPRNSNEYGSDNEFTFALHMQSIFESINDLPEPVVHTKEDALANIEIITGKNGDRDLYRVMELLKEARGAEIAGFDYETNRLRPYSKGAKILSFAVSHKGATFSVAYDHRQARWTPTQRDKLEIYLRKFLYHSRCRKIAHNAAFEMEWSAFFFGRAALRAGPWGDTQAQGFILDERLGALSLEHLCLQYFGINIKEIHNLDRKNLDDAPLEEVLTYNGLDARYHAFLYREQSKRLKDEGLVPVYRHHLRRIPTMVLTQMKGIPIDQSFTKKLHAKYSDELAGIEDKIKSLDVVRKFRARKDHAFRPSSPHDVKFLVQRILGVPVEKVDEDALEKVKDPVVKLIVRWRKVKKNLSTYIESVMSGSDNIFPDGLLHPITNTMSTRTWRTSADSINYQNWPKHDPKSKIVRKQVRPKLGYKVVAFDYAGIQARNVAMESKDPALVKAFWEEYDIHKDWMFRIAKEYPRWLKGQSLKDKDVYTHYRHRAKNGFVFASFFGAQAAKLSQALEIPEVNAGNVRADFFEEFEGIADWHQELRDLYAREGYVTGLSGFRRRAPVGMNEIINTPIQSDESIIVCDAMARLSETGDERLQPNMEIHDDLTFMWEVSKIDELAERTAKIMTQPTFSWVNVPLVVEMSIGDDWNSLEEVAKFSSAKLWNHRRT